MMKFKWKTGYLWLMMLCLGIGWLAGWPRPGIAQTETITDLSFADLELDDLTLVSPAGFQRVNFPIPQEQEIQGEISYINLHYQVFYGLNGMATPPAGIDSARFTITIEDIPVAVFVPQAGPEQQIQLPIPWGAVNDPTNTTLTLRFELFAGENCANFQPIRIVIFNDSAFHLVWKPRPLTPALPQLSQLLQRNQAITPTLSLIIPDQYSEADLSAAAAIAAFVGKETGGEVSLALHTVATAPPELLESSDLVVIGRPEQNQLLRQWYAQALLPTQWLTNTIDLIADPSGNRYQLQVTNLDPTASWAGQNIVAEIPPGHQFQSCAPDCIVSGRLLSWPLPAGTDTFTATLQFSHNNQPIIAAQTPITLSLRTESQVVLYLENSLEPVSEPLATLFRSNFGPLPPQDGLLQLISSPFANNHFALIVTGSTDAGLQKAAQALSASTPILSPNGQIAMIRDVRPVAQPLANTITLPERFTLAQIGFREATLSGLGDQFATASFQIPANWQLQEGATFHLTYLYANTLDQAISGLRVELNGQTIGSIPLNATGNEQSVEFALPMGDLRVGQTNNLRFVATLFVNDPCAAVGTPLAWVRIRNLSQVFIPHQEDQTTPTPAPITAATPAGDLSDLLFVLPSQPEPSDLVALSQVANQLGRNSVGFGFAPQVRLAPLANSQSLEDSFVIAIGRPTANDLIQQVNADLPQPFLADSDMVALTIGNVAYQLPAGTSLGLLQKMAAPWNQNRPLWLITGTTAEGVEWAGRAFASLPAEQLSGNVTVIQGSEAISFNNLSNSILTAIEAVATLPVTLQPLPPTQTPTPAPTSQSPAEEITALTQSKVTFEIPPEYLAPEEGIPAGIRQLVTILFTAGGLFTLIGLLMGWWRRRRRA